MFDGIILTDTAEYPDWYRGYGAHRIANHMRLNGYSVLVVDFSSALTYNLWRDICKYAVSEKTKFIGISTTWLPYRSEKGNSKPIVELLNFDIGDDDSNTLEIAKNTFTQDLIEGNGNYWIACAKKYNNNLKVIVGGPKIDFYRDLHADHYINGLGETQIIDLLKEEKEYPIVVNHDTEARQNTWSWNESQTLYTDFDFIKHGESLTLETSRGCRFKCAFCSYPLIGQKNMMKYMKCKESLYAELMENYEKWGTVHYRIADDTFNDSTDKLEYLLDVTRRLPFKLELRAYVRADLCAVHPQQIDMLKELGLRFAWIGIDSFHPETSRLIGKGMLAERRINALEKMREVWGNKVEIAGSYILGLPKEDLSSINSAAEYLLSDNRPIDHIEFIPLRLTPLGVLPNVNRSQLDLEYKKFGYEINDLKEFWKWTKNDDTDVVSFEQMNKLAFTLNSKASEIKSKDRTLDLPQTNQITDPITEYFLPLIKKLRNTYENQT